MPDKKIPPYEVEQADKRLTLRAPLIIEKVPCEDTGKTFFGYAKNVSRGGLFVATIKPRKPGDRFVLEMVLPLPEPAPLRCSCEVVWARAYQRRSSYEPGMGLKFVDLPEEVGEQLEAWIHQCLARS
ncbi:MAG: pilus assembly protein PilZ [Desulfuromonas sp.]|nr:MAG: pilus assembly protein PilZ [Desulfuromonas sp.]